MDSDSSRSEELEVRPVFEWYAVRPPHERAAKVCISALEKRHIAVSSSCLLFRRIYPLKAAREVAPPPLEAFNENDDYDDEEDLQAPC